MAESGVNQFCCCLTTNAELIVSYAIVFTVTSCTTVLSILMWHGGVALEWLSFDVMQRYALAVAVRKVRCVNIQCLMAAFAANAK